MNGLYAAIRVKFEKSIFLNTPNVYSHCAVRVSVKINCFYQMIDNTIKKNMWLKKGFKKLKLYHTRGIAPRYATNGGDHLCGLALGQHSFEETWQRWRHCV